MNEFQKQFQEIKDFLQFDDYTLLTKRVIDLTLDTEDILFYKKTNDLLDWLDENLENSAEKKKQFISLLEDLYHYLNPKYTEQKELLISTCEVKKAYNNSSFGLGPIDLEISQGQIIGLVGENGNGKTTLLRLLCGELFPTDGQLKYHFKSTDKYHLRTQLVYIPQRTATWYGSMFDNLQFTATSYGYSAEENKLIVELIIARLGLRKFRNYNWKDLSSGYKMRFELARMLLRKPKVLLIDEPLANLDILAQQTILEDFRSIAKSPFRPIGIILSSQQLYEVEKTSDQVIFLKNGEQKNLYDTNPDNLVELPLIIEFESSWTQQQLNEVLSSHALEQLEFNGGTYIATFSASVTIYDFMNISIQNQIHLQYFRNISNSTRRFFVS